MNSPPRRLRSMVSAGAAHTPHFFSIHSFLCLVIFLAVAARAQYSDQAPLATRSVSGQFIISAPARSAWFFNRTEITANTNLIRFDPALLAVSAERFKVLLWQQVGLKPESPWRGKIHVVLRPAHSPEDEVTITSRFMTGNWDYQLTLPDILTRARYARALSAVLLLEIANRNNLDAGRSAEIPAWLVDGLAQQVLDEDAPKLILSLPTAAPNGAHVSTLDEKQRGPDALATARIILIHTAVLTFDQMSWPSEEQLNGDDGGLYRASAQLFVHELLHLPRGPEKMRGLLGSLPACLNWQTAFFDVYRSDFSRPIEVEKWWLLRATDFAAQNHGSEWTSVDSDKRLAALLRVPVLIRGSSNSLPVHAEISLQSALRKLNPEQRDEVLSSRLRTLELAQYRLARPFSALAAGYCDVLADFLGGGEDFRSPPVNRRDSQPKRSMVKDTTRKLDALDLRRRELAARLELQFVPRNLHQAVR